MSANAMLTITEISQNFHKKEEFLFEHDVPYEFCITITCVYKSICEVCLLSL